MLSLNKTMDFVTKNQTLILVVGGVALAFYLKHKLSNLIGEKLNTLGQGLQNPIDALLANFGILPDSVTTSQTAPTKAFSDYIAAYGGVDKYIADHKNGTFKGAPFSGVTGSW